MANAEDQQDVIAARNAQAEARADVAEFDEHTGNTSLSHQVLSHNIENKSGPKYLREIENPSEQYIELISSVIFDYLFNIEMNVLFMLF